MSQSVTTMPTRAAVKPLASCKTLSEAFGNSEFMDRIKASVPKHMSPDRMLRTFVQAASKTPKLLECNMRSVLGAMLTCSQTGLEPNTPLQHAFLIPFEVKKWNPQTRERERVSVDVQLIFGYPGLLDLSYRSGLLQSVHCDVVWAKDEFSFEYGSKAHLRHVPKGKREEGEQPAYAYMHARMKGDAEAFEVLPYSDVLAIRNASQGFRSAQFAKEDAEKKGWKPPASWTEAPWVKHEVQMARKTAFRAGSKWLPRSIEMAAALALDEAQERGTVDFGPVIDGMDFTSIEPEPQEEQGQVTHEQSINAGAAFGMRQQDQVPVTTGSAEPSTGKAPPVEQKGRPVNQQAAAPAFEAYLVDEWGEMPQDRPVQFTDPVTFAHALVKLHGEAANKDATRENNAEAIQAAQASPEAAGVLQRLAAEPEEQVPDPLRAIDLLPDGRNVPQFGRYMTEVKEALEQLGADQVQAWVDANSPRYLKFPQAKKLELLAIVARRCEALGIPPMGQAKPAQASQQAVAAPAQTQALVTEESDQKDVEYLVNSIEAANSAAELDGLLANESVKRTRVMLTDAGERQVKVAIEAARKGFGGG